MDIVHIASELAPIAKVGGLGDVIYGLSKALHKKGQAVTIMLPYYDCTDFSAIENLAAIGEPLKVKENGDSIPTKIWKGQFEDLNLILIDPAHPKGYFKRGVIYGEIDDNDRFLFFCKACITYLNDHKPDVIHLHDWPTAGAALLTNDMARVVFTIHNLQHQGRCAPHNLHKLDIEVDEEELSDHEYGEALNLMRGAIARSDVITTVSPTYRDEILTDDCGCGLEDDLLDHKKKLKGILNGIDTQYWDPATDPHLSQRYNQESVHKGKAFNKQQVLQELGLKQSNQPLVCSITRLVSQKGPDLILYGIEKTLELGGQFALLGSTPDEDLFEQLAEYENHPNVACSLTFNEPLSHKLYAASDMLLMPSIFEPCGISQLIAMRYGTIPLVRKTGGLKDTVKDEETGFTFDIPDNKGVANVLQRAFDAYPTDEWSNLISRAMEQDYSWDTSAQKYIDLYED